MADERPAGRELVFLGPSLELSRARRLRPGAEFHPPVRFGDLYALSHETPGRVLIIDGVFHDSTPIWQREILHAMRAGWRVFGASSMGALRALELAPYGMVGLGRIYEWYRTGEIEGDDEVALMHGVAETGYARLTLPMVDVRHGLAALENRGLLAKPLVSAVLAEFKCMGHETRSLEALLELVRTRGGDAAAVREQMTAGDSLKTRDAIAALRVLAGELPLPAAAAERWAEPAPQAKQPPAILGRRVRPLSGPPVALAEILRALASRPETLERPLRESRRHWFLLDWSRITGRGPDAKEQKAFAARRAGRLARALKVSESGWRAASALAENEMADWMAGFAFEAWLANRDADELGVGVSGGDAVSPVPLVLVDWMRLNGVTPPEHCADIDSRAAWLVRMGPDYFGALDFDIDSALAKTLAATGELARRAGPPPRPEAEHRA